MSYLSVDSGSGNDVLRLRTSGSLYGHDGDDILFGGSEATSIILTGGRGADMILDVKSHDYVIYNSASESVKGSYDTIDGFSGPVSLNFDSDETQTGDQRDFHFGQSSGHIGDIISRYDALTDQTILEVFTDGDKKADFVVHFTGEVTFDTTNLIF